MAIHAIATGIPIPNGYAKTIYMTPNLKTMRQGTLTVMSPEELAEQYERSIGPICHSADRPTIESIAMIESQLGCKLPSSLVRFASAAPNYGNWLASLGPDYDSPTHILKINRESHVGHKPDNFVIINVGLLNSSEFRHGVEILDDNETPLSFVLLTLQEHAGLSHADASVAVAICHSQGGVLIPMETMESAGEFASHISRAAQIRSLPLKCRAVSATSSEMQSSGCCA